MGLRMGDKSSGGTVWRNAIWALNQIEFTAWMYYHDGDKMLKELFKPYDVYPILVAPLAQKRLAGSEKKSNR